MTVAAVILAARPETAIADADGLPAVRRIAETAWSGGAIPVVVVSFDPDGGAAAALLGTEASLVEPAPVAGGPVAQICAGIDAALGLVGETDAALVWPAGMTWPDPETITSLIEAHGADPGAILRPAFDDATGWPVLVPVAALDALRALGAERMPDELIDDLAATGWRVRALDLGDPGSVHDRSVPRATLPAYRGPQEPASGHQHEWGEAEAEDAGSDEPGA
ncbi:MAG TPA: NTP transferase domain-containing protein [Candidatus Limnocylindrales bacterium]|nr:NTP transferase domain-containing protein [Candidatus Limnocylindrales bacterium]